jgi:glycosyl transferase family 1
VARRPRVAVVAWTPICGRARDLAGALGGEAACFYALGLMRPAAVPLRYALDAVRTAGWLLARRPRALIAVHPPIFAALVGYAWCRLSGTPLVLDAHPSGFGLAGDRLSGRLLRVHAWLARRSVATLVTAPALAAQVDRWGGRALVLHEAVPAWDPPRRAAPADRPRILFAGSFAGDEPSEEVVEAARAVPDVEVLVTGHPRRRPAGLRERAPANVTWLGLLRVEDYLATLRGADAVLALSTEDTSVMRTAYEAVWAERPLIVSDWPYLREVFPHAVHVANHRDGIAAGLRALLARGAELRAVAPAARRRQRARSAAQLAALRRILRLDLQSGG